MYNNPQFPQASCQNHTQPISQTIPIISIVSIRAHIILNSPSGLPKFTNVEFRSNLEQFLVPDGSRNVVVIGHIDCYGIRRAKELICQPRDSDGGQICYVDDWLEILAALLRQPPMLDIPDRDASILNIRAQVKELEDIIKKREGGWGSHGTVTIVGLLLDDTAPGMQPTQLVVREVPRRE